VRAAGNGLAMMPIMTAGLSAIPAAFSSSGSPVNNIAQRVSGSLGLAGLTVLATNQQSQLMADRSALISANSGVAAIQQVVNQGPGMLYAYYQQLSLYVMADAYSNVFLVCCVLTAAGVLLALMLRSGPAVPEAPATAPAPADAAVAAEAAVPAEAAIATAVPEPLPALPLEPAVPHHRGAESGDPHADPRVTVGAAYRRD